MLDNSRSNDDYLYITDPTYGVSAPASLAFGALMIIIGLVGFYLIRAYRKRQGVDVDLLYKEIPPE